MRLPVQVEKLETLMFALGRAVKSPGHIYLTGGATALLHGWRTMTVDVDLKADPEPKGLFEAIAELKDGLSVNHSDGSLRNFVTPHPVLISHPAQPQHDLRSSRTLRRPPRWRARA